MPERDQLAYLEDILKSCEKIIKYINGKNFDEFSKDEMLADAVIRNLETIGEAVKHISESLKLSYSHIEWKKIAGLRDILIHEYFGINYKILWDITANKIKKLKSEIEEIITKEK
ncbi:MAG: hypothetical protein BWY32_01368 [bacterium ADurb.Bin243]|nr:MAG: hypothetical protein BWY32_01368 [bacterium ADurb.Bin243]HOD39026.1 DUF86 domain-containing protein [Candidatus Wallbacteria bacterium]